jgi:hypothetical protein
MGSVRRACHPAPRAVWTLGWRPRLPDCRAGHHQHCCENKPHITGVNPRPNVRAADAKEVGVGNPAEETYCRPNSITLCHLISRCQDIVLTFLNRLSCFVPHRIGD